MKTASWFVIVAVTLLGLLSSAAWADRVVLNEEDPLTVLQDLQRELQDLIDQARDEGKLIIPK